jgi:hypothetical protein
MQLSVARCNALLNEMGQAVTWAKSYQCPYERGTFSGAAPANCPVCAGKGYIWDPPVSATVGLTGMKGRRQWESMGRYETGDVVVTAGSDSPFWSAKEYDRVVFIQSTEPFDSILNHTGSETLTFPVTTVDRAFWVDPESFAVTDADIPTVGFGENPTVTWASGQTAPPDGTDYTISGRRIPEYFVFADLPSDRAHFGGLALPRRIVLRKFDLLGKIGA